MPFEQQLQVVTSGLSKKLGEEPPPQLATAVVLGAGIVQSATRPYSYFVVLNSILRVPGGEDGAPVLVKGSLYKNPDKWYRSSKKVLSNVHQTQFGRPHHYLRGISELCFPLPARMSGGTLLLSAPVAHTIRSDGYNLAWYHWEPDRQTPGQYFYFVDVSGKFWSYLLVEPDKWLVICGPYKPLVFADEFRRGIHAAHGNAGHILDLEKFRGQPPIPDPPKRIQRR